MSVLKFRLLVVGLVFVLTVLLSMAGFWFSDRELPIITEKQMVLNRPYPGGNLDIEFTIHRRKSCPAFAIRAIFDHQGRRHVTTRYVPAPLGPMGSDTFISSISIPKNFSPGVGVHRLQRAYSCNLVQKIWPVIEYIPDIQFQIIQN